MYNLEEEFDQSGFEMDELYPDTEFSDEYIPETEGFFEYEDEFEDEFEGDLEDEWEDGESTFDEATQMELASELLSVSNEDELDHFLGGLISKAISGIGGLLKSRKSRRKLGKILKGIAKKALPMASSIIPGVGPIVGDAVGAITSNLFELELEGLSPEDCEFETAKAFVKFAGNAAKNAATDPENELEDEASRRRVAKRAVLRAARMHAPGLLRRRTRFYPKRRYHSVRRRYAPGRIHSSVGKRYRTPGKSFYSGGSYYYPSQSYNSQSGYYTGTGYNSGSYDTGGSENYLLEKIHKLEDVVSNLTTQLKSMQFPQPTEVSGVSGNTAPSEKEYYEYY